ncbi:MULTISPECIES: TerD family protein [Streptomyces]|uniref:TerD family protein n=2 Tax=Streptomyces TaxID=1883 RepID=A0ABU4K3E2_9ACTN|nr:TerD family protein [Streptomyces roseolus]MDX2292280.1 TerD family protein [Streptomyces roseolus]
MSGLNKGVGKVEVALRWDPAPAGEPAHDLDLVAAVFTADEPHGAPAQLVHFGSRSPDGTITLHRDSRTGQGFGYDEAMTLELDRLADRYVRVVVGVAIQQGGGRVVFGRIAQASVRVSQGYTELLTDDFTAASDATAATVVEFVRDASAGWTLNPLPRGFDTDPQTFGSLMGAPRA